MFDQLVGCFSKIPNPQFCGLQGIPLRTPYITTMGANTTNCQAPFRQTLIGIIGPQHQTILRTRGKHAVGFARPLRDQIIDHHTDISIRTIQHKLAFATINHQRRINPGNQPLPGGFFVTSCSIDLPGKKQASNFFGFQRMAQLTRIDKIIFNRIARTEYFHLFQTGDRCQQCQLNILGQGGRNTIGIDGMIVQPFRFEENLMFGFIGKPNHLILDRRAIARTAAINLPAIHRCAMQIIADDFMGFFGRVRHIARDLRYRNFIVQERKRIWRVITGLLNKAMPFNRAAIQTSRCPGF